VSDQRFAMIFHRTMKTISLIFLSFHSNTSLSDPTGVLAAEAITISAVV